MSGPPPTGVAAFDFDGTLIAGDSFVFFLLRLCGRRPVAREFAASSLSLLATSRFRLDRDVSKADLVSRLLAGYPADRLAAEGERFSRELVTRVRPSMKAQLEWHRAQHHRLLLVSASLEAYLDPLGRALGFDRVLATRLEVGYDGRLTGRLEGPNCRGLEKAVRVRSWMDSNLAEGPTEIWAYGDSAGDREMLGMADHPQLMRRRDQLVRRGGQLTRRGPRAG